MPQQLNTVKVFIPVSIKDDYPDEGNDVFAFTEDYGASKVVAEYSDGEFIDHNLPEEGSGRPTNINEFVTLFLKEQVSYVLSPEEMENLLYMVHSAGAVYGSEVASNLPITTTTSQYISQLLNKK